MGFQTSNYQTNTQAKRFCSYIFSTYGATTLGLLRLLATYELFRDTIVDGNIADILPMSYSFERVLCEIDGIILNTKNAGTVSIVRKSRRALPTEGDTAGASLPADGLIRRYPDDVFSTVRRSVVQKLRTMRPDYDAHPSGSMVPLGTGVGALSVLSNFDSAKFEKVIQPVLKLDNNYNDALAAYDDNRAFLNEDSSVLSIGHFRIVEAISDIFTKLRGDKKLTQALAAATKGSALPMITLAEAVDGREGSIMKPAAMTDAKFRLVVTALCGDGDFTSAGCIQYSQFDCFSVIGSTEIDINLEGLETDEPLIFEKEQGSGVVSTTIPAAPAEAVSLPKGSPIRMALMTPEITAEDIGHGIDHVYKWIHAEYNSLSNEQQIEAMFGNDINQDAYERSVSKGAKQVMAKALKVGCYYREDVIQTFAQYLYVKSNAVISGRVAAILAAGKIISWKSNYKVGCDRDLVWHKIR